MFRHLLGALLLLGAMPGAAAAQEFFPDVVVHHADLDLASASGRQALDRRLRRAIERACPDTTSSDVFVKIEAYRCRSAKRAEVAGQRSDLLSHARHMTKVAGTR
jgi:UrcA family protein